MSKNDPRHLTKQQRADLAAQVKRVRESLGLTQQELATEAGVTRQTIGNIELAQKVPQTKTLLPILEVLNLIPEEPALFTAETERWLAIVGGIMDALPADRRGAAGQAAVNAVTQELVSATKEYQQSTPDRPRDPVSLAERRANVSGTSEDEPDIPENVLDEWAGRYAAHPDDGEPEDHTP